jgi:hypothetical protein
MLRRTKAFHIVKSSPPHCQTLFITSYRLSQSEIEGIANESMTYRDLVKMRHTLSEISQVLQTQVMASIQS